MRTLRFDSIGGASGDMILACIAGLGVPLEALEKDLSTLDAGGIRLRSEKVTDHAIAGTRLTVETDHHAHAPHRHLADIDGLINGSSLTEHTKCMAITVFRRLAGAEAKIHGTTPDKMHFHEVGSLDSIADIVGACRAIEVLRVSHVTTGPLPVGRGTVTCAHGVMPVPVPAVAELLTGFPVTQTDEPFEMVTPTGAALLTTWALQFPPEVPGTMKIVCSAWGIGHRTLNGRANALRATLLEPATQSTIDDCLVMECNIDDMVPELVGSMASRIIEAGALDVFTTPVYMKKQRPGILVTILCSPASRDALLDLVFRESTTFGIREYLTRRTVLEREVVSVSTPYGPVRVKVGKWKGRMVTCSPEHDDCVSQAASHATSVRKVYESAVRASETIRQTA